MLHKQIIEAGLPARLQRYRRFNLSKFISPSIVLSYSRDPKHGFDPVAGYIRKPEISKQSLPVTIIQPGERGNPTTSFSNPKTVFPEKLLDSVHVYYF